MIAERAAGARRATFVSPLLVMAVMVVAAGALFWRSAGLNPIVLADEWSYSLYSRLLEPAASTLPSYLFLALFRATNQCGSAFLECARALNACLFAASVPFVYAIARQFARPLAALALATAAVALPSSSYATYFMPEALYSFGFSVLAWYVIARAPARPIAAGVGAGVVIGAMALVKVHAMFLLPGYAAYLLLVCWSDPGAGRYRAAGKTFALAVLSFVLVRLVGGYLLAGTPALHLLGRAYTPFAADALNAGLLPLLVRKTSVVLLGHVVGLAVTFALPLVLVFRGLRKTPLGVGVAVEDDGRALAAQRLCMFALAMLVPLVLVTATFTAVVSDAGPHESIGRLHVRYYSFLFPLLILIPAAALQPELAATLRRTRVQVVVTVALAALLLAGLFLIPAWYQPNFVDSPELAGVAHPRLLGMAVAVGLVLLGTAFARPRWATVAFYAIAVPLLVVAGNRAVNASLRAAGADSPYDLGGKLTRLYLGDSVRDVLAVGDDISGLFRTRFHLDDPQSRTRVLAPGAAVDASMLSPQTRWVLAIGDHALHVPAERALSTGSAALYRLGGDVTIDFSSSSWPGLAVPPRGLSVRESFGRWSDGPSVDLVLAAPLPSHARIVVEGAAFGPNVGMPFTLDAGGTRKTFTLGSTAGPASVEIVRATDDARITIGIPQPTAPRDLGLGTDSRRLGLSLSRIVIQDLRADPGPPPPHDRAGTMPDRMPEPSGRVERR